MRCWNDRAESRPTGSFANPSPRAAPSRPSARRIVRASLAAQRIAIAATASADRQHRRRLVGQRGPTASDRQRTSSARRAGLAPDHFGDRRRREVLQRHHAMIAVILSRMRLILASASPRRAELLARRRLRLRGASPSTSTRRRRRRDRRDYVLASPATKRASARGASGRRVVLGADTVVVDGDDPGQAARREARRAMLTAAVGRHPRVLTGVVIRARHERAHVARS